VPVGVLIPVYGFAPYLAETLDAVLAQHVPVSAIVVDDGSPTPLTLHADHAPYVSLVRRDVAGGPAAARAAGLQALADDVELVALCDADDAWCPGALSASIAALEAEPRVGWAFGRALVVGPDGRPTGETWARPAAGPHDADHFGGELYAANPVPTSSVVLRRTALAAAGGFASPVRVAEDWELWLRLCAAGLGSVCVEESVVRYRRHPGGLTADVTSLARAQLAVHELHADRAGARAARQMLAHDWAALAAGLSRDGDYAGAREAWAQVAARRPLRRGERARRAALGVPGLRGHLGRGDPYRA
jgi:glycosyltransferase involved in cell wall biosynthesis